MTSPDNVTQQVYKGPETSCIVNGLLPGRPYLFQVRAYNRVGVCIIWSYPLLTFVLLLMNNTSGVFVFLFEI